MGLNSHRMYKIKGRSARSDVAVKLLGNERKGEKGRVIKRVERAKKKVYFERTKSEK
jgi:hypothetical protein